MRALGGLTTLALAQPSVPLVQLVRLGFSPTPVLLATCAQDVVAGRRVNLIRQSEAINVAPWSGSPRTPAAENYAGIPFFEAAKISTVTSEGFFQTALPPDQDVLAGDEYSFKCVLLAGTSDKLALGIYNSGAAWGTFAGAFATIVSGPGAVAYTSSLITVTGLSATEPTVMRMSRKHNVDGTQRLYFYPGTHLSATIGDSFKLAAPQFEPGLFSSSPYAPTTTTAINEPGEVYRGALGLGSIGAIEDSPGEVKGLQFTLSGVAASAIAVALDDADEWQGVPVTIRTAILDQDYQVVDAPLEWTGTGDTMSIEENGDTAVITATAESSAVDLLRGHPLTTSHEDQQTVAPGDRAFEYVNSQADQPVVWPAREWFYR